MQTDKSTGMPSCELHSCVLMHNCIFIPLNNPLIEKRNYYFQLDNYETGCLLVVTANCFGMGHQLSPMQMFGKHLQFLVSSSVLGNSNRKILRKQEQRIFF